MHRGAGASNATEGGNEGLSMNNRYLEVISLVNAFIVNSWKW